MITPYLLIICIAGMTYGLDHCTSYGSWAVAQVTEAQCRTILSQRRVAGYCVAPDGTKIEGPRP